MGAERTLSELLRQEGLVDDDGLQAARRRVRRDGTPLVVALAAEGAVDEGALVAALVRAAGVPRIELGTAFVEMDALREVNYDFAASRCLLPLGLERVGARRVLRVAMADPLDRDAIEEIEASSGCHVEPAVAPASELAPAIDKAYRGIVTKLIHRAGVVRSGPALEEAPDRTSQVPRSESSGGSPSPSPSPSLSPELRAVVGLLVRKGVFTEAELLEALERATDAASE